MPGSKKAIASIWYHLPSLHRLIVPHKSAVAAVTACAGGIGSDLDTKRLATKDCVAFHWRDLLRSSSAAFSHGGSDVCFFS